MSLPLSLYRTIIQRAEAGTLKNLAGALVYIYKTMPDGSAPVDVNGNVTLGATLIDLYSSRDGLISKTNPLTSDSSGYIEAFMATTEMHLKVMTADGQVFGIPWENHINPNDVIRATGFANLQDAVNLAKSLKTNNTYPAVYIPTGSYSPTTVPAFTGLTIPSGMRIYGDGPSATILQAAVSGTMTVDTDLITVEPTEIGSAGGVNIQDLSLYGTGVISTAEDKGRGLVVVATDATSGWVTGVSLNNVVIAETGSWNIYLYSESLFIDQIRMLQVTAYNSKQGGALSIGHENCGANGCSFIGCQFNGYGNGTYVRTGGAGSEVARGAVHICNSTNLTFLSCSFQDDDNSGTSVSFNGSSNQVSFLNCNFEFSPPNGVTIRGTHFVTVGGYITNLVFQSCTFNRHNKLEATDEIGLKILHVSGAGAATTTFDRCLFICDKLTDNATDDFTHNGVDLIYLITCNRINTRYPTVKDLRSNSTQALVKVVNYGRLRLQPLTTTQRNALGTDGVLLAGDMVFNTTTGRYEFYNGSSWRHMDAGAA